MDAADCAFASFQFPSGRHGNNQHGEQTTTHHAHSNYFVQKKITILVDVRRALLVEAGDCVEFVVVEPGRYEIVAAARSVTALKGIFGEATEWFRSKK